MTDQKLLAQPRISDDGHWRWDGTTWVPNAPQAAAPQPAAAAPAPQQRKKMGLGKKISIGLGAVVLLAVASNMGGGTDAPATPSGGGSTKHADDTNKRGVEDSAAKDDQADAAPSFTVAQEQALQSAQTYVDMSGFSRAGLIQQLSSAAGEGFAMKDAVFAANHVDADWNQEAVESAKLYLEMGGFSRDGLIQQLSSGAGEKFTHAQAVYAVNHVGL